ncbi:cyclic GMP-AMP synthase DncV-like nucleotidyltransferase [Deinococcus altitudinis]|uniref:cyclic GMP-AMP synthase DncV-like nucleotidyltransferase n=1 Tax=Deinococcus altitudinis TaxID=468914 RepID=UPI0038928C52
MAHVQKQFETFIDTIKLSGEEQILREKRDAVVTALRKGLKRDFGARNETPPSFESFNQGSYSLKTGIKPEGGGSNYDIDVGIVFAVNRKDHEADPLKLKRWVRDALKDHTDDVRIKTPCVTVNYVAGYHVDLAVYADPDQRIDIELPLSWGKEHGETQEFQVNNPGALKDLIYSAFPDKTHRKQFRRVIRALKRWRDRKYRSATSHAAPVGVGLTVAGLSMFTYRYSHFHAADDDRQATEDFIQKMLNDFRDNCWSSKDKANGRRLVVAVPFAPNKDVFDRINNSNMLKLEELLKALLTDLKAAGTAGTNTEACTAMRRQFGPDFPEGDNSKDESTAGSKAQVRAIVGSQVSG